LAVEPAIDNSLWLPEPHNNNNGIIDAIINAARRVDSASIQNFHAGPLIGLESGRLDASLLPFSLSVPAASGDLRGAASITLLQRH
jgi:hypothetical protein